MTRKALAGILLFSYPVAVHWSLLTGRKELAVLALLLLCLAFAVLFVSYAGRSGKVAIAVIAVVFLVLAAGLFQGSSVPVVLVPLLINAALCWMFGRTLVRGREALITRFARVLEGDPPPEVARYTRGVTLVWCVAFAALALEVALLAAFAALETWSLFANFLNYLLVAALFLIEYGYRRWRFRHRSHLSLPRFLVSLAKADWGRLSLH